MATTGNFTKNPPKVGYAEAEILSRAIGSRSGGWISVRCLNPRAHKNGDKNPSASYNIDTGHYRCRVCDLHGFANDRDRTNWNRKQTRTYPNGSVVHRIPMKDSKRIWQENPQPAEKPYNIELLSTDTRTIYVVEGEKCAEELTCTLGDLPVLALTSIGGSKAVSKTDWSAVRTHLQQLDCVAVFIPDRDEPGEQYIREVARQLGLTNMNVVRLDDPQRNDGYDIADWLEEGNRIEDLPDPVVEFIANRIHAQHGYHDLFGYHAQKELTWVADDMIPARKLTLMVGRSGIGKSTMALHIASSVSMGMKPFSKDEPLNNDLFATEGRVLIYTSEDDWNDTVAVRLDMMRANFDNIAPLRSQRRGIEYSFDWSGHRERDTNGNELPSDLDLLQANLRQDPVTLIIIDPMLDVVSGGNNNDPSVIRQAIETKINPLLETGCAVVGIHHERKDALKGDLLVDRAIGSQAWTGVARSVLHLQALPKHKALGPSKNPKPRESMDRKFNIAQMDMGTNSNMCGVLVVSKSNLANVDGGYHYELPTSVPEGQTSSFIQVVVNHEKIKNRTPEELVQIYNPVAQDNPLESPVNKKARSDMAKEITVAKTAENAVETAFEEFSEVKNNSPSMEDLIKKVVEIGSVSQKVAKEAIRNRTVHVREGQHVNYRKLKKNTD